MDDGQSSFAFAMTVEQWHDEADELTFRMATGVATIDELKRLHQLLEYREHALRTGHHLLRKLRPSRISRLGSMS